MIDHDDRSEWYKTSEDLESLELPYKARAHWAYGARWHDYFGKLQRGLPHLQRFGIDHGPWGTDHVEGYAFAPFKAAASLPARLTRSRYIVFDCGTGPGQWIDPEDSWRDEYMKVTEFEEQYDCWDEEDPVPRPLYPDCWDRDQDALDELLAAVESRRAKDETLVLRAKSEEVN